MDPSTIYLSTTDLSTMDLRYLRGGPLKYWDDYDGPLYKKSAEQAWTAVYLHMMNISIVFNFCMISLSFIL